MAAMNSSMSKSQSFANLGSLKLLQVQLVDWAATWAKTSDFSIPPMSIDLPDIVTLLQALGYKLGKLEAHAPIDISNVSTPNGTTCGVRVVVTCGHSGQVCVLEGPLAAEKCRCTKVPDNNTSGDCFWAATVVGGKTNRESNLIESGCDALPSVSKEVNILVANVLNYLCINGNKELEQFEIPLKETPVSSKMCERYSDSVAITTRRGTGEGNVTPLSAFEGLDNFRKTPSIAVSSPHQNGLDSPARFATVNLIYYYFYVRYRSLDTLTSANAEKILPEPGHLIPKVSVETQKSMDLLSVEDPQESSTSTIGEASFNASNISKLKEAHKLIKKINSSVEDKHFNVTNINRLNEVYKMIGVSLSIRDNLLNSTNWDNLKKADKIIGDIIKKDDKKDASAEKEKLKSSSACNIIKKIMRAPKLSTSAQTRAKVSNSSPNFQSKPVDAPKQVGTIKKRKSISSSSSVIEEAETATIKKRPIVRSSTDLSTKQPVVAAATKTIAKYANIKSNIPRPEPSKRKD